MAKPTTNKDILLSREKIVVQHTQIPKTKSFSIMTYNTLADFHLNRCALMEEYWCYYANWSHEDYLKKSPGDLLERKKGILKEINFHDTDIVCLQELDEYYYPALMKEMALRGYQSFFQRKTFFTKEGLVISVKLEKFNVTNVHFVTWSELLKEEATKKGIDYEKVKDIDIDTVAILLELQHKESGQRLLVCTVHFLYHLQIPDINSLQISMIAQKIKAVQKNMLTRYGIDKAPPVIFTGDFNIEPTFHGYKLIQNGKLTAEEMLDLQHVYYLIEGGASHPHRRDEPGIASTIFKDSYHVPTTYYSAYKEAKGAEPRITSYETIYCSCLDYIFYSDGLILESILDVPDVSHLISQGGVELFPSDHISLVATFFFPDDAADTNDSVEIISHL